MLWRAAPEAGSKYNPAQPRVPAGRTGGGRWTRENGGFTPVSFKPAGAATPQPLQPAMTSEELARFNRRAPPGTPARDLEIDPRFGLPRWYVEGAVNPTLSPLDFYGGSGLRAAKAIGELSVEEVPAALQALRGRAAQAMSNYRIRVARAAIDEFFGEPITPDDVEHNGAGDIYVEKNGKKFRMDVKKTGTKKDGAKTVPEDPHFHLEKLNSNGDWVDVGPKHRFYFKK